MTHALPTPRRFLIIGCGSIGQRHLRTLRALEVGPLVAYDPRADRRREAAALGAQPVETLDAGWAARPDVAFVASPTSTHVELALAAADQGCHLFIEKPLGEQLDERVPRLLALVERRRLITLVGCNLRFDPGLARVRQLVQEGAIGRLLSLRAEAGQYLPDWHPWEDYRQGYSAQRALGGGIILDAIHELDYARWIAGEVERVACFAGKVSRLEIDTEDLAAILLQFAGGAIGEIHLDYLQRAARRTCQVIGEEGTIWWDEGAAEVRWYAAATKRWTTVGPPPGWEMNQPYVDELRHFLACLDGRQSPAQPVEEGARVLEIALAAKASAGHGAAVDVHPHAVRG